MMIQRGIRRKDRHVRRRLAHYGHPSRIPREAVYNKLRAIAIDMGAAPTTETRRQTDILFSRLRGTTAFRASKVEDKRVYLRHVLHALKRALYHGGCVMYPRGKSHPEFSKARLQVIEALIEMELVYEHRSPKGSPKMSRLLPMPELRKYVDVDPWTFDPNLWRQFVYMVDRNTREEMSIDMNLPIAVEMQARLELINQVNSQYEIMYTQFNEWEVDFGGRRRLRPIHYARFTDCWDLHGRLYTGRYGHQALRRIERGTIEFNGCPAVELDYGGMHPRLLYHLQDIDYQDDPYALWGRKTTGPQRLLAKKLINAAINATSRSAAVSACNRARSIWTKDGERPQRKSGKALAKAIQLDKACRDLSMGFGELYDLVARQHAPIAQYFGTDAGIRLMRIDSAIAIDILYHFAKQCIPCLGCHDSFIAPKPHALELREMMNYWYHSRFGYLPKVVG